MGSGDHFGSLRSTGTQRPGASTTDCSLPSTSASTLLFGAGASGEDKIINSIAEAVSKKLLNTSTGSEKINPFWKFYERSEPTLVSQQIPNTSPPVNFNVSLHENDLNDAFDETRLLQTIPKRAKKNASLLLKTFDQQPNEITWDSVGNLYINEQVIPEANIFNLFPYLFRKKFPKHLPGMADFLNKLNLMGLSHLFDCKIPKIESSPLPSESKTQSSSNWWYLGE